MSENTGVLSGVFAARHGEEGAEGVVEAVPHIYAIGDVTAKPMLAHAAEAMGGIAAETLADAETMELDYATATPRRRPANAKAHGLGDATGFVKLISDAKYGELLGAHLIGPDVTELLPGLTLARQWDRRHRPRGAVLRQRPLGLHDGEHPPRRRR